MRDVFNHSFGLDEHGTPRTWRPRDNIPQLARQARREAARVLALLVSTNEAAAAWLLSCSVQCMHLPVRHSCSCSWGLSHYVYLALLVSMFCPMGLLHDSLCSVQCNAVSAEL
jgi:hypothetical protein